jgi:hypothetical protein
MATLAAAAIATAPATSGVPERTSRSWPPPCSSGTQLVSRRSSSAPTPVGPPNLWAATLIAERPLAAKSTGIWPTAWIASLCIGTSNSAAMVANSVIGMMVPTSLLAHMIDTNATSSLSCNASRSAAGATEPSSPTGSQVTSASSCSASHCTASSTAWCSIGVVMILHRCGEESRRAQ